MKWKAPSERVQFWIASPIVIPASLIAALIFLPGIGLHLLLQRVFPRPSEEWHRWYAWRPVRLGHWSEHIGKRAGWAWLEAVERRARPYNWPTEYRALNPADAEGGE